MLVVLPLCGVGERFQREGYHTPKPLVPLHGKRMLFHIIDSLIIRDENNDRVLCVCPDFFRLYDLHHPRATFVYLMEPTVGALDTCVKGIHAWMNTSDPCNNVGDLSTTPVLVMDGDVLYDSSWDVIQEFQDTFSIEDATFAISIYHEKTTATCFSFVEFNEETYHIQAIREKERISSWACSGCYGVRSIKLFLEAAARTLQCGEYLRKGEYYMSSMFLCMLDDGRTGYGIVVQPEHVLCCGTLPQMIQNTRHITKGTEPLRVCFDLDGTLVTHPQKTGDYSTVMPIQRNINYARYLKSQGHIIILHTARRMKTHDGNMGAVLKDCAQITFQTLERFGIPYDEIYFGKPYADFYVDDKAVSASTQLSKKTGVYPWNAFVDSRSFNHVTRTDHGHVLKKSDDACKMECEIMYYRSIPECVRHLFPAFLGAHRSQDKTIRGYEIECIQAPCASFMYVTESMTESHLAAIMSALDSLHSIYPPVCIKQKLFDRADGASFRKRLTKRVSEVDATAFPGFESQLLHAFSFLQEWESEPASHADAWCMIHGDPVFTNILIESDNLIKFIDMRGNFGGMTTIFGDKLYDYAKVYQSLVGYDEILHDSPVSFSYKLKMLRSFWNHIHPKLHDPVRKMTHALLLSLLPLHDLDVAKRCYGLAVELCVMQTV